MGYAAGHDILDHTGFKTAVVYGSVIASFTVENFSVRRISELEVSELDKRFTAFLQLSKLD
jgi:hypothetical protein